MHFLGSVHSTPDPNFIEAVHRLNSSLESVLIMLHLMKLLWNSQVWMLQFWLRVFAYDANPPMLQ